MRYCCANPTTPETREKCSIRWGPGLSFLKRWPCSYCCPLLPLWNSSSFSVLRLLGFLIWNTVSGICPCLFDLGIGLVYSQVIPWLFFLFVGYYSKNNRQFFFILINGKRKSPKIIIFYFQVLSVFEKCFTIVTYQERECFQRPCYLHCYPSSSPAEAPSPSITFRQQWSMFPLSGFLFSFAFEIGSHCVAPIGLEVAV